MHISQKIRDTFWRVKDLRERGVIDSRSMGLFMQHLDNGSGLSFSDEDLDLVNRVQEILDEEDRKQREDDEEEAES